MESEFDDIYPSPLANMPELPEKLKSKREYCVEPLPPKLAFILDGTASNNYEKEFIDWYSKQKLLDDEGILMLAEHYGISSCKVDVQFFHNLLICVLRSTVPYFSMKKPPGRKVKNTKFYESLMAIELRIMMIEDGVNRAKALKLLEKKHNKTMRNIVSRGENSLVGKCKERLEGMSIDKLKIYEARLKEINHLTDLTYSNCYRE